MPLVSICMPTLNARRFLEPRMDSILAQTLTDWELIVCDSVSDDGTWEYMQRFRDDPRVRLFQIPREGLYAGWNECLRRATGQYIYVATADDTCQPELLETMVGALEDEERDEGGNLKPEGSPWSIVQSPWLWQKRPVEEFNRRKNEGGEREEERDEGGNLKPEGGGSGDTVPPSQGAERRTKNEERGTTNDTLDPLPLDLAVCNFDFIDEQGAVMADEPQPRPSAVFGDRLLKPHRRPGRLDFLVSIILGVSWTTYTALLFRRSLLDRVGLFETDCGACADRLWAFKALLHSDVASVPGRLATWRCHPHQGTRQGGDSGEAKRLLERTEQTLIEYEHRLPAHWKRDPDCRNKLLWAARRHYYDRFRLSRTSLRKRPGQFLAGCLRAARDEPRYLTRRLLTGLAWEPDHALTETDYCKKLIEEWEEGREGGREG